MKPVSKAKGDLFAVLLELREMARLEGSLTVDHRERRVWNGVLAWSEATAQTHGLDLDHTNSPGATVPETANDRRPSAGSTRKGDRTRNGASGTH